MPMTAPKDWNQNGLRKAPQQLIAPVLMHDRLADDRAKPRHSVRKPSRNMSAVQWQIRAARSGGHFARFQFVLCSAYRENPLRITWLHYMI